MKRKGFILGALLSIVLIFSLAACSNNKNKTEMPNTTTSDSEAVENESVSPKGTANTEENKNNVLIAYFSYTGNTEKVANQISSYTGGNLVEIKRATPYSDDRDTFQEEAEAEIKDNVRPEIIIDLDNIDAYDVIFVGYPIWWDEAPAMIATFLESYDFSGKTIVPFCTSATSKIDNSLHILTELCQGATIAEGITANDINDIEPWLKKLGN